MQLRTLVLCSAILAICHIVTAQQPLGDQITVDGNTAWWTDVASDANGDFVVVWEGLDGGSTGIWARKYSRHGLPITDAFLVNTILGDEQCCPRIDMTPTGAFVVVWADRVGSLVPKFQLFDASASPVGSNTVVADLRIALLERPVDVAMDLQGRFIVVWDTTVSPGTDTDYAIIARRFDANGDPIAATFQVNDFETGDQLHPRVSADDVGNFVVSWKSVGSPGDDQTATSIQARRWLTTPPGFAGGQFQVNQTIAGYQIDPAVTMNRGGAFAIGWASDVIGGTQGVFVRGWNADGTPAGNELRVDQWPYGFFLAQNTPGVSLTEQGDLYATWFSWDSLYGDDPDQTVEARELHSDATATAQFQVNDAAVGHQDFPGVSHDATGDYVVSWSDFSGVYARRFASRFHIFRDGFESGSMGNWSASTR